MRSRTRTVSAVAGVLGLFALGEACSSSTDSSSPQVGVNSITCVQSGQDNNNVNYTVTVTGFGQGPVGSVLTPEMGKGTGVADGNRTVENIDQSVFTFWSFGVGPDDMTREDGDGSRTSVTLETAMSQAKPVTTAVAVYAHFQLTVPSGTPLDAEKTGTCP